MADWFLNLPVLWMALIIFVATFLIAGGVYLVVTRLAETEWARAFKAVSPGLLPVLGVLFALLVGFIAVEVWNTFDRAKTAVATEASALRAVVLLAGNFPEEQKTRIDALINRHIEVAIHQESTPCSRFQLRVHQGGSPGTTARGFPALAFGIGPLGLGGPVWGALSVHLTQCAVTRSKATQKLEEKNGGDL